MISTRGNTPVSITVENEVGDGKKVLPEALEQIKLMPNVDKTTVAAIPRNAKLTRDELTIRDTLTGDGKISQKLGKIGRAHV